MTKDKIPLPQIVSRDEWLVARKKLLAREKEATHARDALNAERRSLPIVKIDKDYVFERPAGEASNGESAGPRAIIHSCRSKSPSPTSKPPAGASKA